MAELGKAELGKAELGIEVADPGAAGEQEGDGQQVVVAVPVGPDGVTVGPTWGKADRVALAVLAGQQLLDWEVKDVGWAASHDAGTHGAHHARVVRFLREHQVGVVVVDHVGEGMRRTLGSMGITLVEGASGEAKVAVLARRSRIGFQPRE